MGYRIGYLDQGHWNQCINFVSSWMKSWPISLLLFWTKKRQHLWTKYHFKTKKPKIKNKEVIVRLQIIIYQNKKVF